MTSVSQEPHDNHFEFLISMAPFHLESFNLFTSHAEKERYNGRGARKV